MIPACTLLLFFLPASTHAANTPDGKEKPNVLFIAVDDLKPLLGCYGDPLAKTPNIDRLAAQGTVFNRAYCMQAVCSPSRNSVMTGLRPEVLQIYDLSTHFRLRAPEVVTLPQYFKQQGWQSQALGKLYHVGHGNIDDTHSWSVPHFKPKAKPYLLPENQPSKEDVARQQARRKKNPAVTGAKGAAYENADVGDDAYHDGKITTEAVKRLKQFKQDGTPFFLAIGYIRPHLPFNAPQKYWDMHDPARITLADRDTPPDGAPAFAPQFGGELRAYAGIQKEGALPADVQRKLIHGYYAATSYMDAQVGRLLDELNALGLQENTIIVLWGDHGWHLGDHGMWCKHTNYEQATRSPLIISAPGKNKKQTTQALTEFVDIYPTLCELAGLELPKHLGGTSLIPYLDNANAESKPAAFQVYPRSRPETGPMLGHAVRTDHWRYVEWQKKDGSIAATELYDMQTDPGETKNMAADSANAAIVKEHHDLLTNRLQTPLPEGLKLVELKKAGKKK